MTDLLHVAGEHTALPLVKLLGLWDGWRAWGRAPRRSGPAMGRFWSRL